MINATTMGIKPSLLFALICKEGGIILVKGLCTLFRNIWDAEGLPSAGETVIIVSTFQKVWRTVFNNHTGISLILIALKMLTIFILHGLLPKREGQTREAQDGYRSDCGCIDQIFTLRQILEHRHIYRKPTVVFLNIKVAFDSLDEVALWEYFLRLQMPQYGRGGCLGL